MEPYPSLIIPVDMVHKIKRRLSKCSLENYTLKWDHPQYSFTLRNNKEKIVVDEEGYDQFNKMLISMKNLTIYDGDKVLVVGHLIGRGKFGKVYTIRYPQEYQDKAIKYISDPDKYTEKECQIHSDICQGQAHIVKYYKMLKDRYIMIELCRTDIKNYYRTHRKVTSEFKQHLWQIASQLQKMHDDGVVHCDIKSANILIGMDGLCKITDFGLALYKKEYQRMNRGMRGTPSHMAPEILTMAVIGDYFDRVDVWAYGVMLYKLIFKKSPFYDQGDRNALFNSIMKDDFIRPSKPQKHQLLLDLLEKCLTKVSYKRPSMAEISQHPWFTS